MPSVGTTPTSSPASQQNHNQLQQLPQQNIPAQQPSLNSCQQKQPSTSRSTHTMAADYSLSSSNSFSSADTNQTLLNCSSFNNRSSSVSNGTNKSFRAKFMIITPAVSIDRNFDHETGAAASNDVDEIESHYYNGNYFQLNPLNNNGSTGSSSDSSLRSNYNSTFYQNRRHHLLSKTPNGFYTSSSWRWCNLICAAMRCFGGGQNASAPYSTSFTRSYHRPPSSFQSNQPFRPLPPYTTPRKTRDHLNNITYEL